MLRNNATCSRSSEQAKAQKTTACPSSLSSLPNHETRSQNAFQENSMDLVNLMDMEDIPELGYSADLPSSEDDLDDSGKLGTTLPRIDLITRQIVVDRSECDSKLLPRLVRSNSSIIRRFLGAPEERNHTILVHENPACNGQRDLPNLYHHDIRYEPLPGQANKLQTVSITNIAPITSLKELMTVIRGGTIVYCHLLDTLGITGSMSALIRFIYEKNALDYIEFAAIHPVAIHGRRIQVRLVQSPSWPLPPSRTKAIVDNHLTRVLEVKDFPRNVTPNNLCRDLRINRMRKSGPLEYMKMREDGILELRFSSIDHAERAYAVLTTWPVYRQCHTQFAPDPCNLPPVVLKDEGIARDPAQFTGAAQKTSETAGNHFLSASARIEPEFQVRKVHTTEALSPQAETLHGSIWAPLENDGPEIAHPILEQNSEIKVAQEQRIELLDTEAPNEISVETYLSDNIQTQSRAYSPATVPSPAAIEEVEDDIIGSFTEYTPSTSFDNEQPNDGKLIVASPD
ncbi:hypothetical protein MMC19_002776 [Ptychographa xylographoides]|nr:hypothetical protein [Ptychographa xylographoides]